MKNKKKIEKFIFIIILIYLTLILGLLFNSEFIFAQRGSYFQSFSQLEQDSQLFSQEFEFFEFTEFTNNQEMQKSIDIDFPVSGWNITNIELNFSDISLEREIKIIEDEAFTTKLVYRKSSSIKRLALGVQLEISVPTTIYGVYIHGCKDPGTFEVIPFYIMGYNDISNNPDDTVLRSIDLNMSSTLGWYYQDFSSNPITLGSGNYSLVMDGRTITSSTTKYYWSINDVDPLTPFLHTSEYINSWSNGIENTTLLYKIVQKVERSYNPEDINMTAEIKESLNKISNGPYSYSGRLIVSNLDINITDNMFHIRIYNNLSVILRFNLSYSFDIYNKFFCNGTVLTRENFNNFWFLEPNIERLGSNYSFILDFPLNWYNFTVIRDGLNITNFNDVIITNYSLKVLNSSVIEGAEWSIRALSPNADFDLNLPISNFEGDQQVRFSVIVPEVKGTLLFILKDSSDFLEYSEEVSVDSEETLFSYHLPSKPPLGVWKIFIFWHSEEEAGVKTITFSVVSSSDFTFIYFLLLGTFMSIFMAIISFQVVKKYKSIKETHKNKLINKYLDVLKLNYIIISDKNSGLNLHEEAFVIKSLDSTLISAYLNALKIFGIEMTGSFEQSQSLRLDFENLKILMSDYKNLRIIVFFKENPSNDFLEAIRSLSYDIDREYGKLLKDFDGSLSEFQNISEMIKKHLNTIFISPLRISEVKNIDLNQFQLQLINEAKDLLKKNKLDYFFATFLMNNQVFDLKRARTISFLIENNIFKTFTIKN